MESPAQSRHNTDFLGINSIASLTNNPHKQPSRIQRSELPAVPATHYPRSKLVGHSEYLSRVGKLHETYTENQRISYQAAASELSKYKSAIEDAETVLQDASRTYSMASGTMAERLKSFDGVASELGLDTISELGDGYLTSWQKSGGSTLDQLDIDSIPTMFFEKDFDIRDPTTFELAMRLVTGAGAANGGNGAPGSGSSGGSTSAGDNESLGNISAGRISEATTNNAAGAALSNSRLFGSGNAVLPVLSKYLDVVEGYLAREISRRSPLLFAALSALKELHAETDQALHQIKQLRLRLKDMDVKQCQPGLSVIRTKRTTTRLRQTLNAVELLARANAMHATIEDMASAGDAIGALDMILETQRLMQQQEQEQPDRVADSWAHRHIQERLSKTLSSVTNAAQQASVQCILYDMESFIVEGEKILGSSASTTDKTGTISQEIMEIYEANLQVSFASLFKGLVQAGRGADAIRLYRSRLQSESERLVEQLYPQEFPKSITGFAFSDVPFQKALHASIRALGFDAYKKLLVSQFHRVSLILDHCALVRKLAGQTMDDVERATKAAADEGSGGRGEGATATVARILKEQRASVQHEFGSTMEELSDMFHARCAKLLSHRADQNAHLGMTGFAQIYSVSQMFTQRLRRSNTKMGYGLKSIIVSQSKAFLNNFHSEKTRQLCVLIENEQWVQADVPVDFQAMVNNIVEGKQEQWEGRHLTTASMSATAATKEQQDSLLYVGGTGYPVVGCSLMLIKIVIEYLECARTIESLVVDVVQRLTDVLKVFNSRTCQVILGAGAMQSAGLKNISAKHIALASQALGLVIRLIPYVQSAMQHTLSRSQFVLLEQFDKAENDYREHQVELFQKLVTIMAERANVHCHSLEMTGWDELTGPGAPQEPTQAMEQLVREIRKLHKVLKKYLQPRDLTIVMQYIYEMYEQKLSECTESLMPELGGRGGRRLASELDFFLQRMRSLDTQVAGRAGRLEALMTELKSKGAEEEVYASPSAAAEGTGNEQRRGNSANSTDDC